MRAARAARLFFHIQQIKSFVYGIDLLPIRSCRGSRLQICIFNELQQALNALRGHIFGLGHSIAVHLLTRMVSCKKINNMIGGKL